MEVLLPYFHLKFIQLLFLFQHKYSSSTCFYLFSFFNLFFAFTLLFFSPFEFFQQVNRLQKLFAAAQRSFESPILKNALVSSPLVQAWQRSLSC